MSEIKMFEVVEGSIFVFGEEISRSKEKPWLFSLTHIHRVLKENWVLVKPVKEWKSAKPSNWWKDADTGDIYPYIRKECREKTEDVKKDIEFWSNSQEFLASRNLEARNYKEILDGRKLSMREVLYTVNGGKHCGTYASRLLVISYLRFVSPKFSAYVDRVFLRYMDGDESLIPEVQENKKKTRLDVTKAEQKPHRDVTKDYSKSFQELGCWMPRMYNNTYIGVTGNPIGRQGVPKPVRDHIDYETYLKIVKSEAHQLLLLKQTPDMDSEQAYEAAILVGEELASNGVPSVEEMRSSKEERKFFSTLDLEGVNSTKAAVLKFAMRTDMGYAFVKAAVRDTKLPLHRMRAILNWYTDNVVKKRASTDN